MTRKKNFEVLEGLVPFIEIPAEHFLAEHRIPYEGSFVQPDLITKDLVIVVELKMFNNNRGNTINGIGYWLNQNDRYARIGTKHIITALVAPSFEEFYTKPRYVMFFKELIANSTRFGRSHEIVFATNQKIYPNRGYDAFNDSMEIIALFQALLQGKNHTPHFQIIGDDSFVSVEFGKGLDKKSKGWYN